MNTFLNNRLLAILKEGTYRTLPGTVSGIDFWSNDYLGLARTQVQSVEQNSKAPKPLKNYRTKKIKSSSATGSRLISGDQSAYHELEDRIASHHGYPAALVFNAGYTANLGLLSALLRRTDTIVYDELSHACCRDGIRLGQAKALRFRHNDLTDLRLKLEKARPDGQLFVLTEGRFSMDGDLAPLKEITDLCTEFNAHLIVDEAHSGGIEGEGGAGLVAALGLQERVFATVITYGKAFGSHGAAVLGSEELKDYLVNTCRPFIYTTGPAPAQWESIARAYDKLAVWHSERCGLLSNHVKYFQQRISTVGLGSRVPSVDGPIQLLRVSGNEEALDIEERCREAGLLVKAIRSPTVPAGSERIRLCLHAFNTPEEIDRLVSLLVRRTSPPPAISVVSK